MNDANQPRDKTVLSLGFYFKFKRCNAPGTIDIVQNSISNSLDSTLAIPEE